MTIAALVLPLLITMSGGQGGDAYNLVVDGVDDRIDCTLNGEAVAHFTFGQSGATPLKTRPGPNVLVCTPKDTARKASHACWAFRYRLFKNWDEIAKVYSSCCSSGCPDQPDPVRTDFEAR